MSMKSFATKAEARAAAREARARITPMQRDRYNAALAQQLATLPEVAHAAAVLTYAAAVNKGEPDPNGFAQLLHPAPLLAFPRVITDCQLSLHVCPPHELCAGAFGIPEPSEQHQRCDLSQVQAVLLPGLAFDRHGGRIGYGKGYYDRLLDDKNCSTPLPLIGVTFDETLYDELPTESHDRPVDLIITPTQIVRI